MDSSSQTYMKLPLSMFFILIFLPKAISFYIWRLKCVCIFILFTKKVGQYSLCKFLDYMDSSSQTYMKWPLQAYYQKCWQWFVWDPSFEQCEDASVSLKVFWKFVWNFWKKLSNIEKQMWAEARFVLRKDLFFDVMQRIMVLCS